MIDPSDEPGRGAFIFPLAARLAVLLALLAIPLAVLAQGWQPPDDALRHVAKAVSGRPWKDVVVTPTPLDLEPVHAGWHALLAAVYHTTGCTPDLLLVFGVSILFIAFALSGLAFVERPESWAFALLVLSLTDAQLARLLLGRPFVVEMAAVVVMLFAWPRLDEHPRSPTSALAIIASVALATWMHTSWYLFAVPLAAVWITGRWRTAFHLGVYACAGILLGACFGGHPYDFLYNTFWMNVGCMGRGLSGNELVGEFQPSSGDPLALVAIGVMLIWGRVANEREPDLFTDGAFVVALACWLLGFSVGRFWYDLGVPALAVWLARRADRLFAASPALSGHKRFLFAAFVAAGLFGSFACNRGDRWTSGLRMMRLTASDPAAAGWLPDAGGVAYCDNETLFHRMFFDNPTAPWKYDPGWEITLAPPESLEVYSNLNWTGHSFDAYRPWLAKMKPADRLILQGRRGLKDGTLGLQWRDFKSYSIGRLPR